jgi:hypothetical protein
MTELTSDPHGPGEQPPPGLRLTGWKEIAAYLDKAVRTVQRWERDFDLPVRRASDDRISSVYAFSTDLDAWLRSPAGTRAGRQELLETNERPPDPVAATETVVASDRPPMAAPAATVHGLTSAILRHIPAVTWVLAIAVVVLAGLGAWHQLRDASAASDATHGSPAAWKIDGDTLTVLDAQARPVFHHRFAARLEDSDPAITDMSRRIGFDDLDGDGGTETWFVARESEGGGAVGRLVLFNEDGTIRWSYRFDGTVGFGQATYGPPWAVRYAFVTPLLDGSAGRALWVASIERAEFPSVLQRLDAKTGAPLSTYWSNGYISSLATATWKGKAVVLVGASSNETKASSLAVLDAADPNGSAPAVRDNYRCVSCGPKHPLAFVVFPRPARFAPLDESGTLIQIDARRSDALLIRTAHTGIDRMDAVGLYRLDGDLRPTSVGVGDGYQAVYESKVRHGLIPRYSKDAVDPDAEFLPILHFVDGRFVPVGKVSK